jgi:cysteine synthase A
LGSSPFYSNHIYSLDAYALWKGRNSAYHAPATKQQRVRRRGTLCSLQLPDEINDIQSAVRDLETLAAGQDDIFLPREFVNPDNIEAHRTTTGVEILRQVKQPIDAFVMGVGTGNTIVTILPDRGERYLSLGV